ncbi:MAG: endonuclease/exonuclease/phosphatase family protein [Deltaproteobacteria bacterium]|nr:endonuclease/exonuclease/phosphatase family protein [Deltaproteobacteria bacterium]
MFTVTTWNVLHRVHAENWNEDHVVATWPDEAVRAARIARWVAMACDRDLAVALQEVSGDQVAALRREGLEVVTHSYERVPRTRGARAALADCSEQLVIASRRQLERLHGESAGDDPGKGFLAARAGGGPVLVCTHVSSREKGRAQLDRLACYARGFHDVLILGDFNAAACVVAAACEGLVLAAHDGGRPTRLSSPYGEGRWIDHGLARGRPIRVAGVEDCGFLSDHNPVRFEVGA